MGRKSRGWLAPLDLYPKVGRVAAAIREIQPDLVHAMRLPFEGIMATLADPQVPLLASIWGNDLTLHAENNPVVAWLTRKALKRIDALHCDCARDITLAKKWGFDAQKPSILLPGGGGIQLDMFSSGEKDRELLREFNIPNDAPVVLNPRGFRHYVRNDVFFESIPSVLELRPETIFVGMGMAGNPVAEAFVSRLGISKSVRLIGNVSRDQMPAIYRLAEISVSPSNHDGTPNTLIEAMSCGCLPVAGDIESVREWVTDGVNGFLCDPNDPRSLAKTIVAALAAEDLRKRAQKLNADLVAHRAEFRTVMNNAIRFYGSILKGAHAPQQSELPV